MKRFITTITLQKEGAKKQYYRQPGQETPRVHTAFPILQLISDHVGTGEEIGVLALLVGKGEEQENFRAFMAELEALAGERGFTYRLDRIVKENDEQVETVIRLFSDIIGKVQDQDSLYACITYGTKPMAIITTMTLHYAYRIKKDVKVEAVVYGLRDWNTGESFIYDTTSLFYIDSMIDRLAEMKVQDPEAALRYLLGTEDQNG